MNPSDVNNAARAMMGGLKRWYNWTIPKTTAGTSTAYTLAYDVAPGSLADGMTHVVRFDQANGAAATLNINALGARALHSFQAGAWSAVTSGAIQANAISRVTYDLATTAYRLLDLTESDEYYVATTSSAAFIEFASVPSWVNHLDIYLSCRPGTNGAGVVLQTYDAAANLDVGASDYYYMTTSITSAGTSGVGTATQSNIPLSAAIDNGNAGFKCKLTAEDIQAATYTIFSIHSKYIQSSNGVDVVGSGARSDADRITGARFSLSSGTGTWRMTVVGRR